MGKRRGKKRMAKKIRLEQSGKEALMSQFAAWLNGTRFLNKKLTFDMPNMAVTQRAKVSFTATAFAKMQYLIQHFDSEVAWHGVCKRIEDKSEFIISDIMLYPQEVTGATVNTDQTAYQNWLYALDDEQFNNCRFQGHSHVNMGTTASAVDLEHQDGLLAQVPDDGFYVFGIFNKTGKQNFMIYDLLNNVYFDEKDVDVDIVEDESGFKAFTDSLELVTKKTYSTGFATGTGYYTGGQTKTTTTQPIKQTTTTPAATTPATTNQPAQKVSRADGFDLDDYGWGSYGSSWGY